VAELWAPVRRQDPSVVISLSSVLNSYGTVHVSLNLVLDDKMIVCSMKRRTTLRLERDPILSISQLYFSALWFDIYEHKCHHGG
jgi:hypothetical protein